MKKSELLIRAKRIPNTNNRSFVRDLPRTLKEMRAVVVALTRLVVK
jgi:hypothetical protein